MRELRREGVCDDVHRQTLQLPVQRAKLKNGSSIRRDSLTVEAVTAGRSIVDAEVLLASGTC
jgi:hypothetical protein